MTAFESSIDPLNVVLGGTPLLGRLTGIGRYTLELAKALIDSQVVDDLRLWGDVGFSGRCRVKAAWWQRSGFGKLERENNLAATPKITCICTSLCFAFLLRPRRISTCQVQWQNADCALFRVATFTTPPNFIMPHFDGAKVITIHDLSTIRFPQFHRRQMVAFCESGIHSAVQGKVHVITDSPACGEGRIDK